MAQVNEADQKLINALRKKNGFDNGAIRRCPHSFYHAMNHVVGTNEYPFFNGTTTNKFLCNLPQNGRVGNSANDIFKLDTIGFEFKPTLSLFSALAADVDTEKYLQDMYRFWSSNAYVEFDVGSHRIANLRLQDCPPPTQFKVTGNTTDTTTAAAGRRLGASTLFVDAKPLSFKDFDMYINGDSPFTIKLVLPTLTFATPAPLITSIIDGVLIKTA